MASLSLLLTLPSLFLTCAASVSTPAPDSDGKYWISTPGLKAAFIPYGASITNLHLSDKHSIDRDVIAGFDNATHYTLDESHPHLGGVPGRYANRIGNSSFTLPSGETYHVLRNDNPTEEHPNGTDTLHGGPNGWDYRNFTVVSHTLSSITFSLFDPDGSQGFPGDVLSYVTYTLMEPMTWDISITAFSLTEKTPVMLTSHVYWNLDGFANDEDATVMEHELHMPYGGMRVGVDDALIPTGDILRNEMGRVNDFWSEKRAIGRDFGEEELEGNCGANCTGYDNCYLISRPSTASWSAPGNVIATLASPYSGIRLDVYTDQPAFQFYSCNFQDSTMPLKSNQGFHGKHQPWPRTIPKYGCVVLEVQEYIDGINHPEWGRVDKQVFGPEDGPAVVRGRYVFSVEE